MFLEDDNLLILILTTLEICLTIDAGWLELTLMHVGLALDLLNGLWELLLKLRVTSKKLTIFRLELNYL